MPATPIASAMRGVVAGVVVVPVGGHVLPTTVDAMSDGLPDLEPSIWHAGPSRYRTAFEPIGPHGKCSKAARTCPMPVPATTK
jgi:hypothetical protein